MAEYSVQKPFAAGRNSSSPLESLVRSALVRSGNFSPARVDGEVMMLMIELANRVIEDIRRHPYWEGGDIDYYIDQTQTRAVPDIIMIDGLTAHYMIQQASEKAVLAMRLYQSNMSDILYERKFGNKEICVEITDGGSNKAYKPSATTSTTTTDAKTGTTTSTTTTTSGNVTTVSSNSY
jgi:hypothetical protein